MGALLGVIFDIHRVHTNPEDPMDVRNDLQQDMSSIHLLFKFLDVNLGSDFVPSFKKVTCKIKFKVEHTTFMSLDLMTMLLKLQTTLVKIKSQKNIKVDNNFKSGVYP